MQQPRSHGRLKPTELDFQQLIDNNEDDLSSDSSSSSFSSSSQQQSSVDYEAEDENEDKQRQPKHKIENESLLHVQNFLKCFGPNAYTTGSLAPTPTPAAVNPIKPLANVKPASTGGELRAWRHNFRSTIPPRTAAATLVTTIIATSQAGTENQALPLVQAPPGVSHKPAKFQINTKFLRKPRNKLMKMLPTTTAGNPEQQDSQQDQLHPSLLFNDDSNAKFKDFSIDSLLNK